MCYQNLFEYTGPITLNNYF